MIAIVDSGPLYAALDADDSWHEASLRTLGRADLDLVIPAMVLAEVTYMVQRRLGNDAEAAFLRGCGEFEIVAPTATDLTRMSDLVSRYANFPLGGTDASVVALAERLGTEIVLTVDRRHFLAVRPLHCDVLSLLPE